MENTQKGLFKEIITQDITLQEPEVTCYLTTEHLSQVASALDPILSTIKKQETIDDLISLATHANRVKPEYYDELEKFQRELDEDFQNQIKRQGETLEAIYCLLSNSH
ncbi:hypothetical protein, partial [Aerococcus urinae]|uniref:hypothetical protein n=3 Tax=Lactobacillales TaxID=186826 RepID=UPI00254A4798